MTVFAKTVVALDDTVVATIDEHAAEHHVEHATRSASADGFDGYRIAAIVPCYNEEVAIGAVVRQLRASVPGMTVYVYDNASTDRTADEARRAGAVVRREAVKGKGNVVRRAFADIDADIYLMIDGDDTYDADAAPLLVQTLIDGPYDHVLGVRRPETTGDEAYRPGHERGNEVLNAVVGRVFGTNVGDMLSGYRAFSRRFVKSFPAAAREFEIETELTVHCLSMRVPTASVEVGFRDRPVGSESKLRTYRDGSRILHLIVNLARHERPTAFYGSTAALFVLLGIVAFVFGAIPLSAPLFSAAALLVIIGLVLDGTRKARYESSRLAYLAHSAVPVVTVTATTVVTAGSGERRLRALDGAVRAHP